MITVTVDRHDGRVRLSWYDASWRVCQTTITREQARNICEALTSLARSAAHRAAALIRNTCGNNSVGQSKKRSTCFSLTDRHFIPR